MPGFRHILFPVDVSESSKAVCSCGKSFVGHFQTNITLTAATHVGFGSAEHSRLPL